jgi:hypothetical protein
MTDTAFVLPGFVPRKEFAKQINRCERTVKRLEDAGKIVVVKMGNHRLVDVEKTLARLRGEDKRRGRGRAA